MATRPFAIELVYGKPGERSQERLPDRFATEKAAREHALLLYRQGQGRRVNAPAGVRVVELRGQDKAIVWIHPPELAHRSMLLANQAAAPLVWLLAAGAGAAVLYFATRGRRAPTALPPPTTEPPAPTPARCVGTQRALDGWAQANNAQMIFLPQRSSAPTKSELSILGYSIGDPQSLVVVLSDTSFWTYTREGNLPVRRSDLRADYCSTVT